MNISQIYFLFTLYLVVVPVYWLIGSKNIFAKRAMLIIVSFVMLWLFYPPSILILFFYYLAIWIFDAARRYGAPLSFLKQASWLLFSPLLFTDFLAANQSIFPLLVPQAVPPHVAPILGLSFSALRAFLAVRDGLIRGAPSPSATLLSLSFFPTFLAGPITGPANFESARQTFDLEEALAGVCRIGWGAGLFLVAGPLVEQYGLSPTPDTVGAWRNLFVHFAALFFDFAGYSEVAIGSGLLFGIKIPENFRVPFLARSMQEFWQRWHISLSSLIGIYLAKPMTRAWGQRELAILVSFIIVGLWHRVSPNYLIWGAGHGLALVISLRLQRLPLRSFLPDRLVGVLGWTTTMTTVAVLSAVANADGIGGARTIILQLAGLAS